MNEINVIRRELRALGITRRCRCYGRIVMAIQLAVDQNIRTAVQIAWRTNPELLREMAGYPLDGPPTASEFLEILSNDVQRAMERREEGVSSTPGI